MAAVLATKFAWVFLPQLLAVSMAEPADDWALRAVHGYEAWDLLATRQLAPGAGVVIAHLDTGISAHPELAGANILWEKAHSFLSDSNNVEHRFVRGQFPAHGHGTETLSVMVSPPGCPSSDATPPCVTGVAPGASVMPLQVTDNSVIGSGRMVADAVYYAVKEGAHVINISLGNVTPMPALRDAIRFAGEHGVIVVAAAGNSTGAVRVYPGAYPDAIAVGGTTTAQEPWSGSTRGLHLAWSAPALDVMAAFTRKDESGFHYSVERAAGTSDATAITSGIAALWLAYHGRDTLLERYGAAGLVDAFRNLVVTQGVSVPDGWPRSDYGAGIIDAEKLLRAELN
jgi:serine protease